MLTSRKPEAKAFKKWLTGTVIPTIRKTGSYVKGEEHIATAEAVEDLDSLNEMIQRALQRKAEMLEERVAVASLSSGEFGNLNIDRRNARLTPRMPWVRMPRP